MNNTIKIREKNYCLDDDKYTEFILTTQTPFYLENCPASEFYKDDERVYFVHILSGDGMICYEITKEDYERIIKWLNE